MSKELVLDWVMRPYAIRLTPLSEEDGGGWIASIPQLGADAYTGTGETADEAVAHLRELQMYLFERLAQAGDEPPAAMRDFAFPEELPNGQISLRIPREIHGLAKLRAEANGCSLNSYLESMLSLAMGMDMARQGMPIAPSPQATQAPVLAALVSPALVDTDTLPLAG